MIIDILIMPWKNFDFGENVLTVILCVCLALFCPILYWTINKNSRITERSFNHYFHYVIMPLMALTFMVLVWWPIALVVNSLFLPALFDKKGAKGACYRERHNISFRACEIKDKKYYDESEDYSKEEIKKYLPNPILYCALLYLLPILIIVLLNCWGGYVFWPINF